MVGGSIVAVASRLPGLLFADFLPIFSSQILGVFGFQPPATFAEFHHKFSELLFNDILSTGLALALLGLYPGRTDKRL